jgi:hypothetical protein
MALHDPRPDFDEERGWQADMRDEQLKGPRGLVFGLAAGALAWVLLAAGVAALTLFLAAPAISDMFDARLPDVCHGYAAECVAAAEGAM